MFLIEPKSSRKFGSGEKDMDGVDNGKAFWFSAIARGHHLNIFHSAPFEDVG